MNFLLPELLSLIASCIDGESDELAKIGLKCLVVLCSTCGPQLSVESWWMVLDAVMDVLRRLQPQHLQSNDTRVLLGLAPVGGQLTVQAAVRKGSKGQPDLLQSSIAGQDAEATHPPHSAAPAPAGTAPAPVSSADAAAATASPAAPAADAHAAGTADGSSATPTLPSSPAQSAPVTGPPAGPPLSVAAPPPSLPFTSASIGVRSRTSLLLMDSLYDIVLKYFPQRPNASDPPPPLAPSLAAASQFPAHVDVFRSPTHTQESLAGGAAAGSRFTYEAAHAEADANDAAAAPSSLWPSVAVKRPVDRRVLGALTCAQFFFCLDVLHESIAFSHRFNADLTLRRRLFQAGLVLFEQSNRLPQLFASEAHALKVSVLLLAHMYKHGIPHQQAAGKEAQQPPSFLRELPAAPSSSSTSTGVPHLSVSPSALSPSSSARSAAAQHLADALDFDCSCWESERRLFALISAVFAVYLAKVRGGQLSAVESSDEVCAAFIEQFSSLPAPQFHQHLPDVWQPIVDLVEHAQTQPLRATLRRFFMGEHIVQRTLPPPSH